MATKAELIEENAQLKQRIEELEGASTPEGAFTMFVFDAEGEPATGMEEDAAYLFQNGAFIQQTGLKADKGPRVRDEDGEFAEPQEGVMYRYDGSGDFVAVAEDMGAAADQIEMLTKDNARLEIERNDARNAAQNLKAKLADMGSLHGRVDNLPGVVG